MARRVVPVLLLAFGFVVSIAAGCSKHTVPPTAIPVGSPETELTYAPLQSDTANFRVHLFWNGYDNDGEVVLFRYAIDADTVNAASQWSTTTAQDSVFVFPVDPISHVQGHVFWIAAQDNDGRVDPTPAKRYFSTRTLPPKSHIVRGPSNGAVTGPNVLFSWEGTDPDGGTNGERSPLVSFEYILLRPGTAAAEGHPLLPPFNVPQYVRLINGSTGTSLAAPYDDWTWTSTKETSHRFTGLPPGYYVFAVRAVDAAGAHETDLNQYSNIRWFIATASPPGPGLTITSNILLGSIGGRDPIVDPELTPRPIEFLTSQVVTFAWTATPSYSGAPVIGYSFALEDTLGASWSEIDPHTTSMTLPADLGGGPHFLWIRAVDSEGGAAVAMLRLNAVLPEFRRGPPLVLWVDDFTAPGGNPLGGSPNYPADTVDNEWWRRVLLSPLASEFGFTFNEWDTFRRMEFPIGRGRPSLHELAQHRVVIWSVDLNNTLSSQTGLWLATVGGISSDLANYVRGGGTLIITGFVLTNNVTGPSSTAYAYYTRGICASLPVGTSYYPLAYFMRSFMGIDAARSSDEGTRTSGARDFVEARVTSGGQGLGFESAEVDTGGTGTGAKWDPYALQGISDNPDITLAPGLPKVEGWKMQSGFACGQEGIRAEHPGEPIAVPLFTYHGVNQGVLQNGLPSKREDLVVGIATQAHDLGESPVTPGYGDPVTPNSRGMMGRMVFLGFPIYYMKDAQAHAVMRAAFAYVNASPTLSSTP